MMFFKQIKLFSLGLFVAGTALSVSADIMKDFDSLGGNDELLDQARALNPEAKISVVQGRVVDRRSRHEVAINTATVVGGNPYVSTNALGLGYQYHINPRWSVGVQGNYMANELTKEGEALSLGVVSGEILELGRPPELDFLKSTVELVGNWYPLYGKFSVYDLGVVHFDTYVIAGVGQAELKSGTTQTFSYGLGLGLWLSQNFSTRVEIKSQNYKSQSQVVGSLDYDLTTLMFSAGWLL